MPPPESPDHQKGQPGTRASWAAAALFGLCPRCGARTLFDGPVKFAAGCRACGLDFAKFNVGDGPAAFLTLVIGALVVGLALWLEFSAHPPVWVHIILWPPLVAGLTLGGLRVTKGALLAAEVQLRAREVTNKDLREP